MRLQVLYRCGSILIIHALHVSRAVLMTLDLIRSSQHLVTLSRVVEDVDQKRAVLSQDLLVIRQ